VTKENSAPDLFNEGNYYVGKTEVLANIFTKKLNFNFDLSGIFLVSSQRILQLTQLDYAHFEVFGAPKLYPQHVANQRPSVYKIAYISINFN